MSNKIGFIGCGEMASAIIKGLLSSGFSKKEDIIASTKSELSANRAKKELNIHVVTNNLEVVKKSDIIIIATKPSIVETVLNEIKLALNKNQLIISIAAGVSTQKIETFIPSSPVIRVMPNTPALVLEGMSATCKGKFATENHEKIAQEILSNIGKVISVEEEQIDIVTAISGSGPAFFYQIFEDIANAGSKLGLNYEKSLALALQTAIGAAKMTSHRTKSMPDLISSVCTKGGCTEVGINYLKEADSQNLFFNLIKKTAKKAHSLG